MVNGHFGPNGQHAVNLAVKAQLSGLGLVPILAPNMAELIVLVHPFKNDLVI